MCYCFFQAEDGIRDLVRSRGLGDVYKRQELKSYKFYLNSFRNDGIYFESVTNRILDDLVTVCKPRYMKIRAEFNTRGGISSVVEVEYEKEEEMSSLN